MQLKYVIEYIGGVIKYYKDNDDFFPYPLMCVCKLLHYQHTQLKFLNGECCSISEAGIIWPPLYNLNCAHLLSELLKDGVFPNNSDLVINIVKGAQRLINLEILVLVQSLKSNNVELA